MTTEHKPARHRSPSYPGVGLADAIERARAIYEKDRMNPIDIDVANAHWGYKAGSSQGYMTVSALMKFGLATDEGSGQRRKVRLTEAARRIILGSDERPTLIRAAALSPAIHADLQARYPDGLPSKETLRQYLLVERNFNENAVGDFIDQYLGTLEFAALLGSDRLSETTVSKAEPEQPAMTTATSETQPRVSPVSTERSTRLDGLREFNLPISRRQAATLYVPEALDERGWDRMMAVLNAMKDGILAEDEDENGDSIDTGSTD